MVENRFNSSYKQPLKFWQNLHGSVQIFWSIPHMHHQQTSLSLELPFRCSHKFLVSLNRRWQFLSYYLAACSQYISPYPLTRSMMFSMANTTTQNAKRIDCLPFVFRTKLFHFVSLSKSSLSNIWTILWLCRIATSSCKALHSSQLDSIHALQQCVADTFFFFRSQNLHNCLSAFFVFSHILTMSLFSGKDVTHSSSYSQLINVTYNVSFVLKHNSRESYNFVSTAAWK